MTIVEAKELREHILSQTSYVEIVLPHAGTIKIHSYISGRAMDTYIALSKDPEAAFRKMVEVSTEGDSESIPTLTEDESEIIARYYAENQGFLSHYIESRKSDDVFRSFFSSFSATELWQNWQRDLERLRSQLTLHTRLIPREALGFMTATDALRKLGDSRQFSIPTIKVPKMSDWLDTRSLAIKINSLNFQPKFEAASQLAELARANLRIWSEFAQNLRMSKTAADAFTKRFTYLNDLNERAISASRLLQKQKDVFSSYETLAESFTDPRLRVREKLDLSVPAFDLSRRLVKSATDFFLSEPMRWENLENDSPYDRDESPQARQADEHVLAASRQSDGLVQVAGEQAILIGNDVAIMLREVVAEEVGSSFREIFNPYKSILDRMLLLANPRSFLQTLQAFATHFQRDYWKDLWADFGKKFKQRPEGIARMALAMFITGIFQDVAFVGRELGNGDGFIDLLVNYLGLNYVVEVKILGASWSFGDAKSGLDQLDAYIQNYGDGKGYLLVFDGRVSNKGEQFESEYKLKSGAVVEVVVVRSYFERPSS